MLLEAEKVSKEFGGKVPVKVLHDVDFAMERGEFAALVGPSGSGKTTLLNVIATLDKPTTGRVAIGGLQVHDMVDRALDLFRNEHLGFVFQDDLLLENLTALENVMIPGRIGRRKLKLVRRRAVELLDRVGLIDRMDHRPGQLSGGQRQRVNLARALMNEPDLLLADEPTARLDQKTGEEIIALLEELNQQLGITILMVTHDQDMAGRAGRRVEFLDGRIVSDRRPAPEKLSELEAAPADIDLNMPNLLEDPLLKEIENRTQGRTQPPAGPGTDDAAPPESPESPPAGDDSPPGEES
jgi:ABC-type lipoprotein export system ATPase subunit